MLNKKTPRFVLKGFSQEQGSRRFIFEGIEEDHARSQFTVHADLGLIRLYGIPLQELPLLCRELLERSSVSPLLRGLIFTEDDMREHRSKVLAAGQNGHRKYPRRPPKANAGTAWRTTAPLVMQPS